MRQGVRRGMGGGRSGQKAYVSPGAAETSSLPCLRFLVPALYHTCYLTGKKLFQYGFLLLTFDGYNYKFHSIAMFVNVDLAVSYFTRFVSHCS